MRLAGTNTSRNTAVMLENLLEENEQFAESYQAASAALLSLQAEDVGWLPLNRVNEEDGFSLESLQEIADYAELQATGNPLLKRGFTIRRDNVFGRGISFQPPDGQKIAPRHLAVLGKPSNVAVLFSKDAYDRNERAQYIAGNLIMAYRISTQTFFPIPFNELSNFASNPDLKQDVWYYQRSWTEIDERTLKPKNEPTVKWYPVLERWEDRARRALPKSIADKPLDADVIIIDMKVNTVIGRPWGVPDCLPAMPYAWAHAEYIRDASKLLKALSTIAWKVVAKSKGNAVNASTKMATPKTTASTATMSSGTDLVAMPRSGQVDMKDGQTIAAYVASALEVSLVALLSDPSTASGSYGAAATLDGPSANAARARQSLWANFYKRVYRAVGVKDILVNFGKIQEDPIYRTAQTLQIGFAYGAIHQDEFRAAFLDATDVIPIHDVVPEPTPFTTAAQYSLEAQQINDQKAQAATDAASASASNVQGQGVSKGAGAGLGSDNTNRNADATPGTGA
jgi:hypothetical protein